jgi:AcrR family transcriptional regulator
MSSPAAVSAAPAVEKRRRRLLDSALLVFSRRGFHETRIEDVCAEAGISRATFYRYFESKEALFDALVDLMSEEVIDIASHLEAVTPDEAGFVTLSRWIGELLANTQRWGSVVNEIIRPRDEHAAARNRAILLTTRFAEILGERFKEGGVDGIDPQMAALAIIAMTERMATQMTIWNVEIDRDVLIPSLATMALKMLHPTIKFASA